MGKAVKRGKTELFRASTTTGNAEYGGGSSEDDMLSMIILEWVGKLRGMRYEVVVLKS